MRRFRSIRVVEEAYDAFQEYVHGLEMEKPPETRLAMRTTASEAMLHLLENPNARQIREKAPERRRRQL